MLRHLIRRPSRNGLAVFVIVLLLPALVFRLFYKTGVALPAFVLDHPYFHYDLYALEPRDGADRQRCIFPRVHPFDPSILGFLSPPKNIVCQSRRPGLTAVDKGGRLVFNESQVESSGYKVGKSLNCFWSKVERGGGPGNVDDVISYGKESPMPKEGVLLPSDVEILRVICRNFLNIAIYDRVHFHVRDVRVLPATPGTAGNFVNVFIFGLDSMSRLAFIRQLPLTYKYLTEELKMTVFKGMNKVGENTQPNLLSFLTGKVFHNGDLSSYTAGLEGLPLIWSNYSQAGYATLWAEDLPDFGLFNYPQLPGFRKPPTLHYLRPFWLALKKSPLLKISSELCYGTTPRYLLQMEYLRQFISVYGSKGIPYFGLSFLVELSHQYKPRTSSADVHFRAFFRWLADSGELDNTLLIVMSDHGHRYAPMRKTRVGHIEGRTPFFAVRFPTTLISRQPKILVNLLVNSGRLVTPFDAYATLLDLLEFVEAGRPLGVHPMPPGILGRSLFGQIPEDRTCKDASVPGQYCVCETVTIIDRSDDRAVSAAWVIVDHVNRLLEEVGDKCSRLMLRNVLTAHLVKTMEDKEDGNDRKVRVVLEVEPSLALFEATVIVHGDSEGEVWGEVSRINQYAGQSDCIHHAILRMYCFCVYMRKTEMDLLKL